MVWLGEWFLEHKEDPQEAIKREVQEELMVSCTIESWGLRI